MSEGLFPYYDRELRFIRELAQDFARQYRGPAGRLLLEANQSIDPHVERLIEAFALLAGRIHHKLDDEFPELTDALFGILYPHYLAPIPSQAVVQFDLDPARGEFPKGFLIDRHSPLRTEPVRDGLPCRFRTGYPVTLWPVGVSAAKLLPPPFAASLNAPPQTGRILRLELQAEGPLPVCGLGLDRLRLYLSGDNQVVANLYELVFNRTKQVAFRALDGNPRPSPVVYSRPEECLHPVGFGRDEGLLPYPKQSFVGYQLLTEFFAFPSKFLFLDLGGWAKVRAAGFQRRLEVLLYLERTNAALEQAVDADTFRLGCVPVINLFEQTAEPIALTHTRYDYPVLPDVSHPRGMEVYAVDSVTSVDPVSRKTTEYQPFYSFRHGGTRETQRGFWYASRKQATGEGATGTDVSLHLVDLDFDPRLPAAATLVVRTTCTNRDLPAVLEQAGEHIHFDLDMMAPVSRLRCLRTPSAPLRPALRRGAYWRLISHLSLNHLSLTAEEGRHALQELLRLYDFSPQAGADEVIAGVAAISSRRVVGRTGAETSSGFCRGVEVTIDFEEQNYVGRNLFLFASVLERFLGLYVTVNSFSQLVARTRPNQERLKKWPPRAGEIQLL